jgi:RimJ/RimL family protein N-acetyltransferase
MAANSSNDASHLFPWITRDEVFRIETPRLWLRWQRPGDADALQAIAGQRRVAEMTATWPHPLPAGEAAARIAAGRLVNAEGSGLILALTRKGDSDRLIGQIGCNALAAAHLGLGYMLDPAFAGQGLATEAVHGFVRVLFTHTSLQHIAASCRVNNPASRRVLEKVGFQHTRTGAFETVARGTVETDFLELSRSDWRHQLAAARRATMIANVPRLPAGRDISAAAGAKTLI